VEYEFIYIEAKEMMSWWNVVFSSLWNL